MKAALFIHRANHSQFNEDWGVYDFAWPNRLLSDIDAQLNSDEQRYITKLYVSAFLDATLRSDKRFIPLFRDYGLVENWLPKTAYISRFQDSTFRVIADFDTDIDPGTTSLLGGMIIGQGLSRWFQKDIDYHYFLPFGSRSNRVMSVSWQAQEGEIPQLRFKLPKMSASRWKLYRADRIMFSIVCPDLQATPDVGIKLTDISGKSSQIQLSHAIALHQPLHYLLTKLNILEEPSPVLILQTVSIPLARFLEINPTLDQSRLREIDFVFNNDKPGTILLDDIGFDH